MRMKRKSAVWLLLCGLLLLPAGGHAREPLVLSLIEYPPLSSAALNGFGIAPAIVRAAFEKTGIPVTYQFYPPARAFTMAKTGQVGGLVGWVRSDEREQWFVFTDSFFEAPLVFFHLKSIPFDWKTYDDLTDLRIGITVKNYYGPEFHTAMDAGKLLVDEAPTIPGPLKFPAIMCSFPRRFRTATSWWKNLTRAFPCSRRKMKWMS